MRRMADDDAKVLRAFVKGHRLVSIPARQRKKAIVLRYLVDQVLPDATEVDEPEMNARLAAWHPDVAALRRYLVDTGLAGRTGMRYRRSPDLPPPARDASSTPDGSSAPGSPPLPSDTPVG
jgi:hypothetical protein